MWSRLLVILLALVALLPVPAAGQTGSPDLSGAWALKLEGTAIFRFDIARDGGQWNGTWWRPRTFGIDDKGGSFYRVSGPAVEVRSGAGKAIGDWTELTFPDNRPGAVPDVFRVRLLDPERAELIYVGTGLAPFVLTRVPAGTVAGPWEAGRSYKRATVASLGLPPDTPARPAPAPQAAPRIEPNTTGFTLPAARRTTAPPPSGGR